MKILVIIPAYNEEASLPGVIDDLRAHFGEADILVVNDGSKDNTGQTAAGLGVRVVDLPFNLGIGGAMQTGFLYARQNGYDAAIQFDGDGQHCASEIEKLLGAIRSGHADLVIGSRFVNAGTYRAPFLRRTGIWIFSTVLSRILDTPVTDSTSGFRAVNRKVIDFFAESYPEDYPEVEALVLLHKKRMSIREVPVVMQERTGGTSSITPLRSAYYMIKVMLAILIDLMKEVR
ncbi:MAG TPA: glycosyltransferase family 2 protein [Nitrospirota bacterium]|nr:glycosyltransferase family 2 protein [Nitrospirota bacterium]